MRTGIVMRSKVVSLINGTSGWEWLIITNPLVRDGTSVTRREALDYIEEHGLVEAYDAPDGTIWDTPGRDFQRRFRGVVSENYGKFHRIWET